MVKSISVSDIEIHLTKTRHCRTAIPVQAEGATSLDSKHREEEHARQFLEQYPLQKTQQSCHTLCWKRAGILLGNTVNFPYS